MQRCDAKRVCEAFDRVDGKLDTDRRELGFEPAVEDVPAVKQAAASRAANSACRSTGKPSN